MISSIRGSPTMASMIPFILELFLHPGDILAQPVLVEVVLARDQEMRSCFLFPFIAPRRRPVFISGAPSNTISPTLIRDPSSMRKTSASLVFPALVEVHRHRPDAEALVGEQGLDGRLDPLNPGRRVMGVGEDVLDRFP